MLERSISSCPVCRSTGWQSLLVVENAPVSCGTLFATQEAALHAGKCRLDIVLCGVCGHVWNAAHQQGSATAYTQDYYSSKTSSPQAQECQKELAEQLDKVVYLEGKRVVEIGCGDGFFLSELSSHGAKSIGFEPSSTYEIARNQPGVQVVNEAFDFVGDTVSFPDVDLVVLRHVLEHLDSPDAVLQSLSSKSFGHPGPQFLFIEVPNVAQLLRDRLYFDFYNDHIHYFSYESTSELLRRAGWKPYFQLGDDDEFLRLVCVNDSHSSTRENGPKSDDILSSTASVVPEAGRFKEYFNQWKNRLLDIMTPYLAENKRVAVWGAGSRGVALLAGLGLPPQTYRYVVDTDLNKYGKYLPMICQPVYSPDQLRRDPVDCVLVTSYTYFDEILGQLDWFRSNGGRIIKVYPVPEVVEPTQTTQPMIGR